VKLKYGDEEVKQINEIKELVGVIKDLDSHPDCPIQLSP
jgi:hypothetical protein